MSLYLPQALDGCELSRLDALAATYPFASLVTVQDGMPMLSHVPVMYTRADAAINVVGHLARPNPQACRADRALVVLRGPQAYVSPGWYPDKADQARVPTWNYVVAHLSGALHWFDDEASLGTLVGDLARVHEARVDGDWRFDMDDPAERVQLRGIVGFRLVVDRVEFKAKLSQNHPDANRLAVIDRLAASSDADARAVAGWMRDTFCNGD